VDKMSLSKIVQGNDWGQVSDELSNEEIKLQSYDFVLKELIGKIIGKKILDYGAGPAILASDLQECGADVKVYDISDKMRQEASKKIGKENVYNTNNEIPKKYFDSIICNLVMCIVDEKEVEIITKNLSQYVKDDGKIYVGFCNPLIHDVNESKLDFRFDHDGEYHKNHKYTKVKKEGNYEIEELHRPIEWYEKVFRDNGLKIVNKHFTPEYELKGNKIQDFIIFELEVDKK
jgi:2-polyprenyl-3-methyl-5-hydroxy-6-metoxy-1,4-benzoquinol methylase